MGLDISPVHVHLSRQHHIAAVQLTNLSHHSTGLFQVSLYRWQQHGNHNVQKATQALVVAPPMVELSPKQRQIIRVGVVHFLPADHELAYRLVLRQVPMNQHNQVSGLRILLATKLPVFVAPATLPKATFKQVVWRLHANKQYLVLTVTNHNKKHIQINGLALSDQHSDHKPFEVPTFVYVLAGQTHTWQIPIKHIDKAAGQWVLAVKANIGHEKVGLPVQKG